MPIPLVFCLIPSSDAHFREAVADVAVGCAPPGLCVLAVFERTPPAWFAIIGRSDNFAEATGVQFIRLQMRLWDAGFYCDQIAHLVDAESLAWGFRVWGPPGPTSTLADVIRAEARGCGYDLPG